MSVESFTERSLGSPESDEKNAVSALDLLRAGRRSNTSESACEVAGGITFPSLLKEAPHKEGDKQKNPAEKPEEKAAGEPLTVGKLAGKHQMEVRLKDNGEAELFLNVAGEKRVFAVLTKDTKAIEETDRKITEMVAEKQKELTKKYKVSFSVEGEDVEKQVTGIGPCETLIRGDKMIQARAPRMSELLGIEAALAKAAPAHLAPGEKEGVKFYFLKDPLVKGSEDADTLANYMNKDKNGKTAVYFWPNSNSGRLITEADVAKAGTGALEGYSIESMLVHELAHNSQFRLGWYDETKLEARCKELGWAPYQAPGSCETVWIIQGKKDGDYFRMTQDKINWLQCDKTGQMLGGDGKPVNEERKARQLSAATVRDLANIRPATEYFDNTLEMDAEALMMFRVSAAKRQALKADSPELYEYVKKQDQSDIDLAYGTDSGKSTMIRKPDGSLGANSAETRKLVEEFEKQPPAKNSQAPKSGERTSALLRKLGGMPQMVA